MNTPLTCPEVQTDLIHGVGFITLNRPRALNALSLEMVRALADVLRRWRDDPAVCGVAIRGVNKEGPFGAFCAGGDIRFFHRAALAGDAALEDFFSEEYALNHLIFTYPKPYIAFMDGIVMGGGMGISQGAGCRVVTGRTKMAMPETNIGLFPDVGGGHFLGQCPGRVGEYLALTGEVIGADKALSWGLADVLAPTESLADAWAALQAMAPASADALRTAWNEWMDRAGWRRAADLPAMALAPELEAAFGAADATGVVLALEGAGTPEAQTAATLLRQRSPLMLHVVLAQVRRARGMPLADELRMERDLVRHCFHPRHLAREAAASEVVEGVRALAVDKDHAPRWSPARLEDVTMDMVEPFFASPWPSHAHPLRDLA